MTDAVAQTECAVTDARFMRLALALGARHLGRTFPNPSVGAVLVRSDRPEPVIVATGATAPGGRPHAEAVAIEKAGILAVGATLYVTLEPCAHRSVRGGIPCVEWTIRSGIARIVSAIEDPNPHIAGLGHALLRSTGVKVDVGLGAAEARRAHRGHILRVTEGRPMLTLKLAQTPDGYAARAAGPRLMITGPETQGLVHLMRARHDAILVGVETVFADDPALDVRLPGLEAQSPIRIVLDSALRLPLGSRLVASAPARPLWVIATEHASVAAERGLVEAGAEVMRVGADPAGRVDLQAALTLLGTRGLTRVLCEGGPTLAEGLARVGLVDEVVLATGSKPLGKPGLPALGPTLTERLSGEFALVHEASAGEDSITTYERK